MVLTVKKYVLHQKLNTIHVLLCLVANIEWPLYKLYVKNVFLNGKPVKKYTRFHHPILKICMAWIMYASSEDLFMVSNNHHVHHLKESQG